MISDVGGFGGGVPAAAGPTPSMGGAMGKEEFLQLLVAQLSNQDPLSPMQAEEFAAQLAQFAQVEQLIELNATSLLNVDATNQLAIAQHNASAMSAIGKEILALGNGFTAGEEGEGTLSFNVGGSGGAGTLVIMDAQGREIAREELGFVASGRHDLPIPPSVPLEEGMNYTYRVELRDEDGDEVEVLHFMRALVDGVRYGPDGPMLLAAGAEIPLGSVIEILKFAPEERDETP